MATNQNAPKRQNAQQKPAQAQPNSKKGGKPSPLLGGGVGGRAPPENIFRLSDCSAQYADCLADPFESPAGACIPIIPAFPSRKAVFFVRGSMSTGTAGVGFVAAGLTAASDVPVVCSTGTAYAGTTIVTSGAGVVAASPNSDYTSASFSSQALQWRPVGCGIRIRYTGTELARGGTVYALEQPDHLSLATLNASDLLKYDACHRFPVDRQWTEVCYAPISMTEVEYTNSAALLSGDPILGLLVAAPSTTSITFDYEYYIHVELVGRAARGKTPSHSDETGFGTVLGAVREHNDGQIDRAATFHEGRRRPLSQHRGFLKTLGDYAKKTVSGFLTKVPGLIKEAGPLLAATAPMLL